MMPQTHDLSTPLAYALAYASIGWRVFPVEQGAKLPVGRLVPQGHLEATTDPETIRRWWRADPKANIGVSLHASGLIALDIDPRNGGNETMDALQADHGPLRSEVMAFTGGGGEHHVFVLPQGLHLSLPGTLGPGVDVKLNGYIVVEPSVHPSGNVYSWEASSSPLDGVSPSPLPDWLRGFVRPASALETPRTATGKVAQGGRNAYISRRAYALKRAGLPMTLLEQALAEINAAECEPPLTGDEVRKVALGKRAIDTDPVVYLATAAESAASVGGLVLDMEQLSVRAGTLRWAVKGVIPEEGLGFIYGASGTGKSFLALDYALHRTYGLPWLGRKTRQRNCVYLAAEGGAGLLRRIQAWHRDRGMVWEDCPLRVVIVPLSLRTEATVLREAIVASGARDIGDVIVDTMAQTYSGNENSNDEVSDWLRTVGMELRDALRCTVLIVHHSGHSATERPRGASAILANSDFCLGVFRDEKQMLVTVSFDKVKDGERPNDATFELARIELGFDEDGDTVTSLAARWLNPSAVADAIRQETAKGRGGHAGALLALIRPGATLDDVRKRFYDGLPDASQDTRKRAFNRARDKVEALDLFELRDGVFWKKGA